MEHLAGGERAPSRRSGGYSVEVGGFLVSTIVINYPSSKSFASCNPTLLPKASIHRRPFIMSSCKTPRYSTNLMAPFCRDLLNLTHSFFLAVFSGFLGSCRSFFPRCARIARDECFDWTRGTTRTQLFAHLGCSGSAHVSSQAGLPTGPPIILAVQHLGHPPTPDVLSPPAPFLLLLPL